MDKSIETIWKEGFIKNNALTVPKLNDFYNKKSKHVVANLIEKMQQEIYWLLVISIIPVIANTLFGNDFIWGIISFIVTVPWFFIAQKNYRDIKRIDYNENCFEYLKTIRSKLLSITQLTKKISILSVPVILFPMLIYTYFNNVEKSFGEIVGNTNIGGSNLLIFLFLPFMTLIAYLIFTIASKKGNYNLKKINELINDMEKLNN